MKPDFKRAIVAILLIALGFVALAVSFEPFAISQLGFVFAAPILWAARVLGLVSQTPLIGALHSEEDKIRLQEFKQEQKRAWKIYLCACFLFAWVAWGAILIWIRHVYPPAGWFAAMLLPLVVSAIFIFPWFAVAPFFLPKVSDTYFTRLVKLCGLAGLWVVLEWTRSWAFSGFPWLLLGESQWLQTPIIQTASIGGVWVVSFTLIFFNLAIEEYFYRLAKRFELGIKGSLSRRNFGRFSPELYLAFVLLFSGVWVYIWQMPNPRNLRQTIRVGLVQPDFAGILKWKDGLVLENLRVVKALSLGLKNSDIDLLALPEAATPPRLPIIGYAPMQAWFEDVSKKLNVPILTGNMAWLEDEKLAQNGSFAIDPKTGLNKNFYAKTKLVPFGEYVPAWASFIGKVVPVGNMKRGENFEPLKLDIAGKTYKVGNMICYEDIFPALGRRAAKNGSDFFFVCTNDSWYGREGGAWQHAAHSALQAVANRKPIARASNNGLSCVFDQYGRMTPAFTLKTADKKAWSASTPSPERQFEIRDARGRQINPDTLKPALPSPLLNENNSIYFRGAGFADMPFYKNFDSPSFYTRYGDWFVGVCAVMLAFSIYSARAENKIKRKKA